MGDEYVYSRSSCGSGAYRMKKSVSDRLGLEMEIDGALMWGHHSKNDAQLRQFPVKELFENNIAKLNKQDKNDFITILKNEIGGINNGL